MSEMTSYAPGTPCWVDLGTTDQEGARAFYTSLFAWDSSDEPTPNGTYTMFSLGGHNVAACYQMGEEQGAMPPMWNTYVAVDDVDAVAAKVGPAGGTLLGEPFDVMDAGRMVMVVDPTGAVFALWQAKDTEGAELVNEPGTLAWNELANRDPEAVTSFYADVLGWEARKSETPMEYFEFQVGGRSVAGMMRMTEQWPEGVPPHWMVYFAVADCDATAARAEELGGKVAVPPTDIPPGRFAVLSDPQGGMFSILTLTEQI